MPGWRNRSGRSGGRSIGGALVAGGRWLVMLPIRAARWTGRQAVGTVRNLRAIAAAFTFDQILPSGITGATREAAELLAYGAGRGSRARGVFSGVTLIVLGIFTSAIGIGLVLIALGGLLVTWNLLRAVPAINQRWKQSRAYGAVRRERDQPLWRD